MISMGKYRLATRSIKLKSPILRNQEQVINKSAVLDKIADRPEDCKKVLKRRKDMTMEKDEGLKKISWWKCSGCGHTLQDLTPPEKCPSCNEKCTFVDVSCYHPECQEDGPDPQLL